MTCNLTMSELLGLGVGVSFYLGVRERHPPATVLLKHFEEGHLGIVLVVEFLHFLLVGNGLQRTAPGTIFRWFQKIHFQLFRSNSPPVVKSNIWIIRSSLFQILTIFLKVPVQKCFCNFIHSNRKSTYSNTKQDLSYKRTQQNDELTKTSIAGAFLPIMYWLFFRDLNRKSCNIDQLIWTHNLIARHQIILLFWSIDCPDNRS